MEEVDKRLWTLEHDDNAAGDSKVHIDQRSEIVMDSDSPRPAQRSAVCHSVPMLRNLYIYLHTFI